jgi:hypothetical protein
MHTYYTGSSGGSLGSSGGSLVATPNCKLQSWVQIQQSPQPTMDCQSLDGLPSGMALCCRLSSEGRQRSIYKKHQKKLRRLHIIHLIHIFIFFWSSWQAGCHRLLVSDTIRKWTIFHSNVKKWPLLALSPTWSLLMYSFQKVFLSW